MGSADTSRRRAGGQHALIVRNVPQLVAALSLSWRHHGGKSPRRPGRKSNAIGDVIASSANAGTDRVHSGPPNVRDPNPLDVR